MKIEEQKYLLPDLILLKSMDYFKINIWQPDKTYIILGRANNLNDSIIADLAMTDKIEVQKRPSGGETVILSPKMLVISLLMPVTKGLMPKDYFRLPNNIIINILKEVGVENLNNKGISDISIGEKKILGSAIYRTQLSVFYHAVLNINEDIRLISRYLKHPIREPDYRQGRPHDEFVTSLWQAGYNLEIEKLKILLENSLVNHPTKH